MSAQLYGPSLTWCLNPNLLVLCCLPSEERWGETKHSVNQLINHWDREHQGNEDGQRLHVLLVCGEGCLVMFIRWGETKHSINQSIIGKRVNLNLTFSFKHKVINNTLHVSVSVAQQNTNELCQRMFHCQCSSCSQVYSHCSAQAHFKFCCGTLKKICVALRKEDGTAFQYPSRGPSWPIFFGL